MSVVMAEEMEKERRRRIEKLMPAAPREVPDWYKLELPNPSRQDDEDGTACREFLAKHAPEVLEAVLADQERATKGGWKDFPNMRSRILYGFDFNDVHAMVQKRERALTWPIFWAREVLKKLEEGF